MLTHNPNTRGSHTSYSSFLKTITPHHGRKKRQKGSGATDKSGEMYAEIQRLSRPMRALYETSQHELMGLVRVWHKDKTRMTPLPCDLACLRKARSMSAKSVARSDWDYLAHSCLADGILNCPMTPCMQLAGAMRSRSDPLLLQANMQGTIDSVTYPTDVVKPPIRIYGGVTTPPDYTRIDVREAGVAIASPFQGDHAAARQAYHEYALNPPHSIEIAKNIGEHHKVKLRRLACVNDVKFRQMMQWLRVRARTKAICVAAAQPMSEPSEADVIVSLINPATPQDRLPDYLHDAAIRDMGTPPTPVDRPSCSTSANGTQATPAPSGTYEGASSGTPASGKAPVSDSGAGSKRKDTTGTPPEPGASSGGRGSGMGRGLGRGRGKGSGRSSAAAHSDIVYSNAFGALEGLLEEADGRAATPTPGLGRAEAPPQKAARAPSATTGSSAHAEAEEGEIVTPGPPPNVPGAIDVLTLAASHALPEAAFDENGDELEDMSDVDDAANPVGSGVYTNEDADAALAAVDAAIAAGTQGNGNPPPALASVEGEGAAEVGATGM